MTKSKINDDDEQTYQLDRRDLLRAGGAAAGVGVAGGIPTMTGIDQPVEPAEAVAPIVAAGAAGVVGLGAGGVIGAYLTDSGDLDSEEVVDTADKQSIYNAAESAILSQRSAVKTIVADLGVGLDSNDSPAWLNQQSNPHRSQIIEHATAETALAWDSGASKSQAVKSGRDAARAVSVTSQISLTNIWNDIVASLSKSIKRDIEGGYGIFIFDQGYGSSSVSTSPIGVGVGSGSDYSSVVDADIDVTGSPTSILSYDYEQYIPTPSEYLPDSDIPDNYDVLTFAGISGDGSGNQKFIFHPRNLNSPDVGGINPNMDGGTTYIKEITASYDKYSTTLDLGWINSGFEAVATMRSNLVSSIDDYCRTVYDSLEAGDISVGEVLSARQLYQELQPSEDVSRQSVALAAAGATGSVEDKVTITTGSRSITGIPFIEAASTIDLSPGTTVAAGDYERVHIILDDGSRETLEGVDFTVDAVNGSSDPDSGDSISFEPAADTGGDPTGITQDEVRKIVKDDQQRYDELQQEIEDLEGGPLGGGIGSGDSNLLLLGGAAVVAYLLGSG